MRYLILFLLTTSTQMSLFSAKSTDRLGINEIVAWEENRGQILYPNGQIAHEVKFRYMHHNLTIFLLDSGLSYQFTTITPTTPTGANASVGFLPLPHTDSSRVETYRINMKFLGANPNPNIVMEGRSEDYTNYYNHNALSVYSYNKITYKNIYPHIDWVIYTQDGGYKYDFVIHPGGNPERIKMQYSHAEQLYIDKQGNLILRNRLGDIRDHAPFAFQNETPIQSSYVLQDSTLQFHIADYDRSQTLTIDPKIDWSTYYVSSLMQASANNTSYKTFLDPSGNIYYLSSGQFQANYAYNGYQMSYGGGQFDILIAKFNPNGARIWATYYGGSSDDVGNNMVYDHHSHFYIAGSSKSNTNIAFNGYKNTKNSPVDNAILTKFDTSGYRIWSTYYGNDTSTTRFTAGTSVQLDDSGYIYLIGFTNTYYNNDIATISYTKTGIDYTDFDGFVAKFDTSCSRIWGRYFGGTKQDVARCATLHKGYLYIGGETSSPDFVPVYYGMRDGYVLKMNLQAQTIWARAYGGHSNDWIFSIESRDSILAFGGLAGSPNNISLNGFQSANAGSWDGFLISIDTNGTKKWGTYFGSTGQESIHSIAIDRKNHIYIAGYATYSTWSQYGGIYNTYQGGYYDGIFAKFKPSGSRIFSSFYGGSNSDIISDIIVNDSFQIFISGTTNSTNNIAYNASQSSLITNSTSIFIAKLSCNRDTVLYDTLCRGDSILFNIHYLKDSGTYYDTLDTWDGCDSFITLHLTVHPLDTIYLYDTICSTTSRYFNGNNLSITGIYRDTLQNRYGCDSLIVLYLQVNRADTTHRYDTLCNNLPKIFNGIPLTTIGVYHDTLQNRYGCDSLIVYHFVPKPIYLTIRRDSICREDSILFGKQYRKTAGIYDDTLYTSRGCDSIFRLYLYVYPRDTGYISASVCRGSGYVIHSRLRYQAGVYYDTLQSHRGCDSIVKLTLNLLDTFRTAIVASICPQDSYYFNGQYHHTAGTYRDTLKATNGCDSFLTLTLSKNKQFYSSIDTTLCHGSRYQGYSQSGTYTERYTTSMGCDSIVTIRLDYLPNVQYRMDTYTGCRQIVFQNTAYNQSTLLYDTTRNYLGCDSIIRISYLIVSESQPIKLPDIKDSFCEEIYHKGLVYRSDFYEIDTIRSLIAPYCDSIYQTHRYRKQSRPILRVEVYSDSVIRGESIAILASGATYYQWSDGSSSPRIIKKIDASQSLYVIGWNEPLCEDTVSQYITALDPIIIQIPNAFSPNGDGKNDVLTINSSQSIDVLEWKIFNRWGEMVYHSITSNIGWDGYYRGVLQPTGVYGYILQYRYLGRKYSSSGELMIIR